MAPQRVAQKLRSVDPEHFIALRLVAERIVAASQCYDGPWR